MRKVLKQPQAQVIARSVYRNKIGQALYDGMIRADLADQRPRPIDYNPRVAKLATAWHRRCKVKAAKLGFTIVKAVVWSTEDWDF